MLSPYWISLIVISKKDFGDQDNAMFTVIVQRYNVSCTQNFDEQTIVTKIYSGCKDSIILIGIKTVSILNELLAFIQSLCMVLIYQGISRQLQNIIFFVKITSTVLFDFIYI